MTGFHTGHKSIRCNKDMSSHEWRHGIRSAMTRATVAEVLKTQGFRTGLIVKSPLGGPDSSGELNRGRDSTISLSIWLSTLL